MTVQFGNTLRSLTDIMVVVMISFLVVQFISGIYVNLFVSFPTIGTSYSMFSMMRLMLSRGIPLMFHMMTGMAVAAFSVLTLVAFAISAPRGLPIAIVGLVSTLAAGTAGMTFVFTGFQNQFYSLVMALAWLFALLSYFTLLFLYNSFNPKGVRGSER